MKAIVTATLLAIVLAFGSASAQWQHMGVFPADTTHDSYVHGIAVTPDGNVWIQPYSTYTRDSMYVASDQNKYVALRVLYVHKPDGQQASFSPIRFVTIGGVTDTLGGFTSAAGAWTAKAGAGLRTDPDGNIIAIYRDMMYKIDYKTGEGIAKVQAADPTATGANLTGVAPGVDSLGYVYWRSVGPGTPLKIYDNNLLLTGNALDTAFGYSRSIEVSKDGNVIYHAGYDKVYVGEYTYNPTSLTYEMTDTLLRGMVVESFSWHKQTGLLWVASGSYNAPLPNSFPGTITNWDTAMWYGYNTATKAVEDSLKWVFQVPRNVNERPRGLAFSVSGDTAYAIVFGARNHPGVRWYTKIPTSVQPINDGVPSGFSLSQNYPNPFNPTTEIQFALAKTGYTTLKIYDLLGREVATIVNENLNAGSYKIGFNAINLASGTYIYSLVSGDFRMNKKMILVK